MTFAGLVVSGDTALWLKAARLKVLNLEEAKEIRKKLEATRHLLDEVRKFG